MLPREGLVSALVLLIMLIPMACFGGGILHVFPPKLEDKAFAVARPTLLVSRTMVTVSESGTSVRIDQTFLNNNEFPLEGLFLLPMKRNVRPAKLDVRVDGTRSPFSIISAEDFFPTLKELTLSMSDPSLLGLAGMDVLMIRPIGIGVGREKSFRIEYDLPSQLPDEQLDLSLSLAGERYSLGPVGEFEISIRFTMSRTVRTVFSPTNHVTILREAPHRCLVVTRARDTRVRNDFRLLTTFSGRDPNLRLYFHRYHGKQGTFMAFIEPPYVPATRTDPDQDLIVLLDTSGSMAQAGFEHAKAVAVSSLERLRPGDRFNVMTLGTHPGRFADRFMSGSRESVLEAVRFVNSRSCGGGSDLYNGLISALEFFVSKNRSNVLLLISDGKATVGITDAETIIEHVVASNQVKARIFVTALGNTSDVALLDRLATSTKGESVHISTADSYDLTMKCLFSRISPPRVSELSLDFQGASIENVVPSPIPDLFGSESAVVFGRFSGNNDETFRVTLRGKMEERVFTVSKTLALPRVSPEYSFIPKIWAMRQMALLAGKRRLKGPLPELAKKAANLAKEFGFINPALSGHDNSIHRVESGTADTAKLLWRFKSSYVPADVTSSTLRSVNGRVFRRDESEWMDTEYLPDLPTTNVQYLSDKYFSLLQSTPQIGAYLALGSKMTVVLGGRGIRVEP